MFRSIIKSALRNILKNRSFTLINLVGLSVSMSLGLLVIMIIKSQTSFDTFHQDAERIYRINTEAIRVDGRNESYASSPLAVATALQEGYAFTDDVVRVNRRLNGLVTYQETTVPLRGLFVDSTFLDVFNFSFAKGGHAALHNPNSLILTQSAAEKIFGTKDPIGETVSFGRNGEFVITGVLNKFEGSTHFEFEALAPLSAVLATEQAAGRNSSLENWNDYYSGYAYLKLKKGFTPEDVNAALEGIFTRNYADITFETRDKGYRFYLQPLTEITPGPSLSNNMGRGMPEVLLIMLGVLAAVVMVMACFNYTQLMIAKSLTRAREIGVRKVVGAHRWQVFIQFVGEAVVFSAIALLFSYGLLQLIKPAFLQLQMMNEFDIDLEENLNLLLLFFAFAVTVGVVAGLLPAGYLSAFKPLSVLRSAGDVKVYSGLTFRKVLMVTQFTLSLVFILLVTIIYRQINFMVNADYGVRQENLVNIRLDGVEFQTLKTSLEGLSGIGRIGGISHSLGTWEDGASDYKRNAEDELFTMRDFTVDENYLLNIEAEFLAGNNFEPNVPNQLILNQTALKEFGFNGPSEALGQFVFIGDSVQWRITGIVNDFHFRPLSYAIGPVAFLYDPAGVSILNAEIHPDQAVQVMAQVEAIWNKLDTQPMRWMMMDDEIDRAYSDAGFFDMTKIIGYISVVAITLACLGMAGMAMYASQSRIKEIGVRKVMGAGVPDILFLLSRSFLVIIGVAVLIGVPVSYFLGEQLLSTFAYKINIGIFTLGAGVFVLFFLGALTIVSQTFRAAVTNPVKSLRYE